jgi:hypothetical protein
MWGGRWRRLSWPLLRIVVSELKRQRGIEGALGVGTSQEGDQRGGVDNYSGHIDFFPPLTS